MGSSINDVNFYWEGGKLLRISYYIKVILKWEWLCLNIWLKSFIDDPNDDTSLKLSLFMDYGLEIMGCKNIFVCLFAIREFHRNFQTFSCFISTS